MAVHCFVSVILVLRRFDIEFIFLPTIETTFENTSTEKMKIEETHRRLETLELGLAVNENGSPSGYFSAPLFQIIEREIYSLEEMCGAICQI